MLKMIDRALQYPANQLARAILKTNKQWSILVSYLVVIFVLCTFIAAIGVYSTTLWGLATFAYFIAVWTWLTNYFGPALVNPDNRSK